MFEINAAAVRERIAESGLTLTEFAKGAGINALTAQRATVDGRKLLLKVIGKIAKFFGVTCEDLIAKKGEVIL